jgi:exodeoxyribonuclease VII large subunit
VAQRLALAQVRVSGLHARLRGLDPEAVLSRGYAIVRDRATRDVVASVDQASPGRSLALQFRDGEVDARVEDA